MAVGMREVAQLAGVSIKTVSNVVNHYPHITAETKSRVLAAIAELDYRPNPFGRGLRTGRTGVIALAVPAIDNPYYSDLARILIKQAHDYGWTVLVDQTDGDADHERMMLGGFRDRMIDGLIFAPVRLRAESVVTRPGLPVVLLGDRLAGIDLDRVRVDSEAVAHAATSHLVGLGRTRIAVVGAKPDDQLAATRLAGYRRALAEAGLAADPALAVPAERWDHETGAQAVGAAIRRLAGSELFDGVVCFNDALAVGALYGLHEAGVRVPEEVAVIGVDDVPTARYVWPPLSSVRIDKEEIARTALQLLAERMSDPALEPRHHLVPFSVLPRVSTVGGGGAARSAPAGRFDGSAPNT